jgi:hypothetical protein
MGFDVFVIYLSYNTFLMMAIEGGQKKEEVYNIYIAINSHNFICTHWFYFHSEPCTVIILGKH